MKKTHAITVHLPEEYHEIIGGLADKVNLSKSEWVYQLIQNDLENRYRQAKDNMRIMARLENLKNHKNDKNGDIFSLFDDER